MRTKVEIDHDYSLHAAHAHHKVRMIRLLTKEIEQHEVKMDEFAAEVAAIPQDNTVHTATADTAQTA